MAPKDIAAKLNGIEYDRKFDETMWNYHLAAKQHGVVIVYGESDDLVEFLGAILEEIEAPCEAKISRSGVLKPWVRCNCDNINEARKYFEQEREAKWSITSLWCAEPNISWTFQTDIPHETFNIMEDGEVFCRGIVFSLNDLQ